MKDTILIFSIDGILYGNVFGKEGESLGVINAPKGLEVNCEYKINTDGSFSLINKIS